MAQHLQQEQQRRRRQRQRQRQQQQELYEEEVTTIVNKEVIRYLSVFHSLLLKEKESCPQEQGISKTR